MPVKKTISPLLRKRAARKRRKAKNAIYEHVTKYPLDDCWKYSSRINIGKHNRLMFKRSADLSNWRNLAPYSILRMEFDPYMPEAFVSTIVTRTPSPLPGWRINAFEVAVSRGVDSSITIIGRFSSYATARYIHQMTAIYLLIEAQKKGTELPPELCAILDKVKASRDRVMSQRTRLYRKIARFFSTKLDVWDI